MGDMHAAALPNEIVEKLCHTFRFVSMLELKKFQNIFALYLKNQSSWNIQYFASYNWKSGNDCNFFLCEK